MAICAGCTAVTGCTCALQVDNGSSTNITFTLTGTGATLDPWILSAAASGGGGTCSEKLYYTVASVGPAGFGGLAATPEPFQSCADFLGDGVNDQVAIQAAVDAAATSPTSVFPTVFVQVGYFIITSPISPRSTTIKGASKDWTLLVSGAYLGGAASRIFDNAADGASLIVSDMTFGVAGASMAHMASVGGTLPIAEITNCILQMIDTLGTDLSAIYIESTTRSRIKDNYFVGGSGVGAKAIEMNNNFFPPPVIEDNIFYATAGIKLTDITGVFISRNSFLNINTGGGAVEIYTIGLYGSCRNNMIVNNLLDTIQREGIVLDGSTGTCWNNQVIGNQIFGYAYSLSATEDGIHLLGDADENHIQQNYIRKGPGGRYGINIGAATCNNNFVTNNDLLTSGGTASLNDAGTATIVAAGNRL